MADTTKSNSRLIWGKVAKIDLATNTFTIDTEAGVVRIRLPRDHPDNQLIHISSEVLLEKWTDAEGKPHYRVSLIDTTSESNLESQKPGEESTGRPQFEAEGNRVGVDREYYYWRQQENHRYEIMAFLRKHLGNQDVDDDHLIEWYQMRQGRVARHTEPEKPLMDSIQQALRQTDERYQKLFHHQAQALNAIRNGKNVVVITQTASGKTLCYNPAIFEHFITSDPSAHALYLFPLNALLMDQKEKIDQLAQSLSTQGLNISSGLLIGGLGTAARREMAAHPPHIIAANPELFAVMLNERNYWAGFFASLRYVVVDEVHTYRGVFGMHLGGLLRRLLLVTQRNHRVPQFILSSATICNPMDLVTRLTSLPAECFCLLDEKSDGSFQANKHWIVADPNFHPGRNSYDSYLNTAAHVMVELLSSKDERGKNSPLNTILFAKTIRDVKKLYTLVQDELNKTRPDLALKVKHYTSADLRADEKREIYEGLKSGKLVGVISTNALEAGIDIGKLDACIIAGFPFWVMRMRQMAGRVGRHQEGLVAFIPQGGKTLDEYYRQNPDLLLTQPPEAFVVDVENPSIACKHINAAALGLDGITDEELSIFGRKAKETAQKAISLSVMKKHSNTFYGTRRDFTNLADPYVIQGLRSNQPNPYAICLEAKCTPGSNCINNNGNSKVRCPNQVTILDQPYLYRDCHPGAVYESMDGELFKVLSLDDMRKVARVKLVPRSSMDRTYVEQDVEITIIGKPSRHRSLSDGANLYQGTVKITRSFTGFYTYTLIPRRRCRKCGQNHPADVDICPKCRARTFLFHDHSRPERRDFPEPYNQKGFQIVLDTRACWLTVPAQAENALEEASPCKLPGASNRLLKAIHQTKSVQSLAKWLSSHELQLMEVYIQRAKQVLESVPKDPQKPVETVFPGVYQHCLLHCLRQKLSESRALEIYARFTGYPVTDDLRHICRKCQSSSLFAGMHTLEHTILLRYPSVALGDQTDLESHTTLGHSQTGSPTIFWYDTYAGGMGASEKVFEQLDSLLSNSERTITSCTCTSLEGCPNCTHLGSCDSNNEALTKPGGLMLSAYLQGKKYSLPFLPFLYDARRYQKEFNDQSSRNERASHDHGIGDEAPDSEYRPPFDPYSILRVQKAVHDPVLNKAYEIRSREIMKEVPPVSALELNNAYQQVFTEERPQEWNIPPSVNPYQILEVTEKASLPMVSQIYRVFARYFHPDVSQLPHEQATLMMQRVNAAYDQIRESRQREECYD